MRMLRISITLVLGSAGLLVLGCSSAPPPKQLVDARAAYSRAQRSQAPQLSPAELRQAKVALDKAEKQYKDDAKSGKTVDLAYIAQRKAELAEAQAATIDLRRQGQDIEAAAQQEAAKSAAEAKGELETTRGALHEERLARADAERALADLEAAGTLARAEARGVVITLPGEVMFATGKSALRPRAESKLDKVADVLADQTQAKIMVEGHTDSTGTDAINLPLSQQRADSVREYLVSEGVPEDRISATGVGASRPIGDNATAEGRAENRRVEIIVETGGMPMSPQQGAASPSMQRSPQPMPEPSTMPPPSSPTMPSPSSPIEDPPEDPPMP